MKRPEFVTNEIYHIYNRGVEKRRIFTNTKDYFRAVHDLFEFNDILPAQSIYHNILTSEVRLQKLETKKPRQLLVEIFCFCLMPNHYHLLLRQKRGGGITEFMRKFGTGYTNYFNTKYNRVGPLFQGKFKAVHVTKQAHILYLPYYIHLNPLDLCMPEWRDRKLQNTEKALRFLESYRWSSHPDYLGKNNFSSVTQRQFISHMYGDESIREDGQYRKQLRAWLEDLDLNIISDVAIEETF